LEKAILKFQQQSDIVNKRPKVGQLWEIGIEDCGDAMGIVLILGKSKEFVDKNRIDKIWRWEVMLLSMSNEWRYPFKTMGDVKTMYLQDKTYSRPLVL
jgi:hypothetical protein